MAKTTEIKELSPDFVVKLFEKVEDNARKSEENTKVLIDHMATTFAESLANQKILLTQFARDAGQDIKTHELESKVQRFVAVKTPRYKRVLRRGESIKDIEIRGRLSPLVQSAGKKFEDKYKEKLFAEFRLSDKGETPKQRLKSIDGASAAFRAVTAAFIDRSGLDQTTRFLLTRKHVLEGELLRVHRAGSPGLHETIAVMDAINQQLGDLVHDADGTGFYDLLVAEHGTGRGWSKELTDEVAKTLAKAFRKQG